MIWPASTYFDKEYLAGRQQTFDECRRSLKSFGKPSNEGDLWMLEHYRYEAALAKYDLADRNDRKERKLPEFNFKKALPAADYSNWIWLKASMGSVVDELYQAA